MDQYCETKFICTHKFSNSFVSGAKFGLTLWRDLVVSLHQKVHSHTRSISSAKDLQYWWSFALLSIYLSLPFSFFWLPLLVCSPSASATYLPTNLPMAPLFLIHSHLLQQKPTYQNSSFIRISSLTNQPRYSDCIKSPRLVVKVMDWFCIQQFPVSFNFFVSSKNSCQPRYQLFQ